MSGGDPTTGYATFSGWGDRRQQQQQQHQNQQYHHPSLQLEHHYNNGSFTQGTGGYPGVGVSSSASGSQLGTDRSAHNVGIDVGVGGINQLPSSFSTVGSSGSFVQAGTGAPGQAFPTNSFTFNQDALDPYLDQPIFGNGLNATQSQFNPPFGNTGLELQQQQQHLYQYHQGQQHHNQQQLDALDTSIVPGNFAGVPGSSISSISSSPPALSPPNPNFSLPYSQFGAQLPHPKQANRIQPPVLDRSTITPNRHANKRTKEEMDRDSDEYDHDNEHEHEYDHEQGDAMDMHPDDMAHGQMQEAKRPPGACARCKSLKVRCEFKANPNICKRCMNGNHECVIPGRKKRRAPPKREHLLNNIREQSAEIDKLKLEIKKLMQLLDAASRRERQPSTGSFESMLQVAHTTSPSGASEAHTPASLMMSSSSDAGGEVSSPGEIGLNNARESAHATARPDVADWIARAKERVEALWGIVDGAIGGSPEIFVEDDGEEEEYFDEADGYEGGGEDEDRDGVANATTNDEDDFAVIDVEPPDGPTSDEDRGEKKSVRTLSNSSQNVSQVISKPRKVSAQNLTALPNEEAPYGLFAKLAISNKGGIATSPGSKSRSRGGSVDPEGEIGEHESSAQNVAAQESYGVMAPTYFVRNASASAQMNQQPHIILREIISPQEAEKLFQIYFDYMNPSCSLLDGVLYTAQNTYWRSPFLFTVICAIASRYTERKGLYEELMTYAQLAAGSTLISGPKTVDSVAAYILLSLYPVPMKKWEDDRTWLYLGMALRLATDLNLNRNPVASSKSLNEMETRELLNRSRIWINCYNLDRSTSSWLGKSATINNNDYIAQHCDTWYKSSEFNMKNFDIQLVAYNSELRLMGEFRASIVGNKDHPSGLKKNVDIDVLASETDEKLSNLLSFWAERCEKETDPNEPIGQFRNVLIRLGYNYARLIILSFGFQHAFGKGVVGESPFFLRCMNAASDVVRVFTEGLNKFKIYLRHGVEAQSVFATFAASFLIKLLHPKYASFLTRDERVQIHRLINDLIEVLSSPEIIIDDRHGPKLWSRFLQGMLDTPTAQIDLAPNLLKLSHRRSKKRNLAQSSSSGDQNREGASNHSSPSSRYSHSPPPIQYPFSSQLDGAMAPAVQGTSFANIYTSNAAQGSPNSLPTTFPDYYTGPLGFDNDFIQSMQSMEDTSIWQGNNLPGFHFLEALQQPMDVQTNEGIDVNNILNSQYTNPYK